MSTLEVNKITPAGAGTTVTLGDSGDTFTIPSGATIANSGTATGFGLANWSESSGNLLASNASYGIYLGVNSATASNLLNDYEEGTWTPSLNGTSGGDVDGRYVKVGRLVTCYMQAWAFTSTAVSATISGFPFSSPSGQVYISGTVGANTWTNNGASVWGYSASGVFVYDCVNQQEATAIAGSPKYFSFSITYYTA